MPGRSVDDSIYQKMLKHRYLIKRNKSIIHITMKGLGNLSNRRLSWNPTKILAWMGPRVEPILTSSIWRYMITLKLKDNDCVAIPINSIKTSSGGGRETADGPRCKKLAHIDIVSSKGILVKRETTSKETRNWDSIQTGSRRMIEENVKESLTQQTE